MSNSKELRVYKGKFKATIEEEEEICCCYICAGADKEPLRFTSKRNYDRHVKGNSENEINKITMVQLLHMPDTTTTDLLMVNQPMFSVLWWLMTTNPLSLQSIFPDVDGRQH